jgi:hypothetical protein
VSIIACPQRRLPLAPARLIETSRVNNVHLITSTEWTSIEYDGLEACL